MGQRVEGKKGYCEGIPEVERVGFLETVDSGGDNDDYTVPFSNPSGKVLHSVPFLHPMHPLKGVICC